MWRICERKVQMELCVGHGDGDSLFIMYVTWCFVSGTSLSLIYYFDLGCTGRVMVGAGLWKKL